MTQQSERKNNGTKFCHPHCNVDNGQLYAPNPNIFTFLYVTNDIPATTYMHTKLHSLDTYYRLRCSEIEKLQYSIEHFWGEFEIELHQQHVSHICSHGWSDRFCALIWSWHIYIMLVLADFVHDFYLVFLYYINFNKF